MSSRNVGSIQQTVEALNVFAQLGSDERSVSDCCGRPLALETRGDALVGACRECGQVEMNFSGV